MIAKNWEKGWWSRVYRVPSIILAQFGSGINTTCGLNLLDLSSELTIHGSPGYSGHQNIWLDLVW